MSDTMMRDEFEAMLIERAWRDPGFRERLVRDPKKAIEAEFGKKIAADCEIVVIDESQRKLGIVIPVAPPAAGGSALGDQDLQKVAGGASPLSIGAAGNWRSLMAMPLKGLGAHSIYGDWSALPGKGGGRAL